jgi:hypothetical protein
VVPVMRAARPCASLMPTSVVFEGMLIETPYYWSL